MRLKSAIWVAAYLRQCQIAGAFVAVRRKGAEESGTIFIKINRLDGKADLYSPAPQTAFNEARPDARAFVRTFGDTSVEDGTVEERLSQEIRFDTDAWIVEIEDREGRHFLDWIVQL